MQPSLAFNDRRFMRLRDGKFAPPWPLALDFAAILTSGGDERLARGWLSGRNAYGVPALPDGAGDVYFSSSTASCVSARGLAAADAAQRHFATRSRREPAAVAAWFRGLRDDIRAYCGEPDSEAILAASGTETELLALAIALSALRRPLTNILVAPQETGRGVPLAASGAHFLATSPYGGGVRRGERLAGLERADIAVETVEIRDGAGAARPATAIDDDILRHAEAALAAGRCVLAHLLDASKTGHGGLSLAAARRLVALAPDRVLVVADCCQLRSSPARLHSLARSGLMVALTGSKFAGGPPFSGALLVPRAILASVSAATLPVGLRAYSAVLDWPDAMQPIIALVAAEAINVGLGLRWTAALSEMERLAKVPAEVFARLQARFAMQTEFWAGACGLSCLPGDPSAEAEWARTIIPVLLRRRDGAPLTAAEAARLQLALRTPDRRAARSRGRGFHLGQPVAVGPDIALRVCLGAPAVNDVAGRIAAGRSFDEACAPLLGDLADLFAKWSTVWATCGFDRPVSAPAHRL